MRYGSEFNPANRFEAVHFEHFEGDEAGDHDLNAKIEYFDDHSRSIVTSNDSPDIPFRYSINPYRGCIHGCSYCYARPTHEYLGWSAGRDFETKIIVKRNAAALFREFLARPAWQPERIAISGVTDCYQPAERQFRLTRQCLEVAWEARQPIGIVTKNALIERDRVLLSSLARPGLIHVFISVTTLDPELARTMEPRTSIPAARLRAIETLAATGVPVGAMVAPIIPGLNDTEIPAILQAVSSAGAITAGHTLLRLPLTVAPVFDLWLQRTQGNRADRIMNRVRQTRDGQITDSQFGRRMTGSGEIAKQIRDMMELFKRKYGLNQPMPDFDPTAFRRPQQRTANQPWLF